METDKNYYIRNITNKYKLFICLFIVTSTLIVYWQVSSFDFVSFDDDRYITENRHVLAGLTSESIHWAFTNIDYMCWQPLTWLSHMLDIQIYGINPGGHHLTNLFFHILNSLLLFLLLSQVTGALWESAFVAFLFALHPINVDSVAWVAQRKNLLCTFFWFLTLFAYALFAKRNTISRYLTTFFAFTFGIMSKPMMVSLPIILFFLDYWPLNRFQGNRNESVITEKADNTKNERYIFSKSDAQLFIEKIPLFFISLFLVFIVFITVNNPEANISFAKVPLNSRIENAFVSYIAYIGKMVFPTNLSFFYPFHVEIPLWKTISAAILLLCTTVIAVRLRKTAPYFMVGWLWYLTALLPVSGIKQAGLWPAMADRWAYIPLIGIFIIIAWGTPDLLRNFLYKKVVLSVSAVVAILFLMLLTWFQVGYWKNSLTLYNHALDIDQNNAVAHYNLGTALAKIDRSDEAIKHFLSILKTHPNHKKANYNLGLAMIVKGKYKEAIYYFLKYLQVCPDDAKAYQIIGNAYSYQEKIIDSKKYYFKALDIDPELKEAHFGLGVIFTSQKKYKDAVKHYSEALRIKPDYISAHINIGNLFFKNGQFNKAIGHYSKALKTDPESVEAHNGLGAVMVRAGRLEKAMDHFKRVLMLKPDDEVAQKNLNSVIKAMKKNRKDF